jgi:uncharacterized protein YqhQ
MAKPVYYGGQALIDGVMMQGPGGYAMAARDPNGDIVYKTGQRKMLKQKHKILGLPFLRGIISFAESMGVGFGALSWSAVQAGESEEEKLTWKEIALAIVIAVALSVVVFVAVPVFLASFALDYVGYFGRSLIEGLLRIGLFIAYIVLIRKMEDIKRVFQCHGAEHKTINAWEAGEKLTVKNVQKYTTINPRCGTSFVFMAMIMMIIVFTFIGNTTVLGRIGIKVLCMPLVVGISYEVYRLPLRFPNNIIVRVLTAPGLWLQKLTTNEPTDAQVEVAIGSLLLVPGFPGRAQNELPPRMYEEGSIKPEVSDKETPKTAVSAVTAEMP